MLKSEVLDPHNLELWLKVRAAVCTACFALRGGGMPGIVVDQCLPKMFGLHAPQFCSELYWKAPVQCARCFHVCLCVHACARIHACLHSCPGVAGLVLQVNGDLKQKANTNDMIFSIPMLVSFISKVWWRHCAGLKLCRPVAAPAVGGSWAAAWLAQCP
jgi:hypothetical protein